MAKDLKDWAAYWGIDFRFPDHFPIRTVSALRAAIVDPSLTDALYRAAWKDNRPIDDLDVLRAVIADAGGSPDEVVDAIQTAPVKAILRDNTELAQQVGACGVPTFQVVWEEGDTHLLWGQDRLELLEDMLQGWRPLGI